mmetsp:Transcript_14152/g.35788  ORF Transcript_14152/g.35788 Transcript_14152/m.35788 type:complete len:798 (+) Transcript_14152:69-2462(+)
MRLFLLGAFANAKEVFVPLPGGGKLGLSTRGSTAFRVRVLTTDNAPIDTPMVAPDSEDAPFTSTSTGISAKFGSITVDQGKLTLKDASGKVLTTSDPIGHGDTGICSTQPGTDITGGDRAGDPTTVTDAAACCDYCKATTGCKAWIFGNPGDEEGNCWVMSTVAGTTQSATRTLGGMGSGNGVYLSTKAGQLYGRGSGKGDATKLTGTSVNPYVDNTATYVPHYYTTDGYAALGVVNITTGNGKTNNLPARYGTDGSKITWSTEGAFELYLMPAATLDEGTAAYYSLIGAPAVPPRYGFGFIASRWGWENRSYIESVLHQFRDGNYPIDAFITDFGWFTTESDYAYPSEGKDYYHDFNFSNLTFPEPQAQLKEYREKLNFRMGGIRKPRLGNSDLIKFATAQGFILPGGETGLGYAEGRNLNYGLKAARDWYAEQQQHYYPDGVSFFWNDEGETDFYTFHWWNVAQVQSLRATSKDTRFYSINRAWSPGMARLGATVWTGDINPSWDDLVNTPGMMLNWGLAGAPYVACDIGGFTGESNADLLTRWYQVGAFIPTMRVHSTKDATPHFPWLWGDAAGNLQAALNLRYQLLPYHYSLAHRMYKTNRLWMRPLVAEYPEDATASVLANQWFDGDLMVAPVLNQDSTKDIYLPKGEWYSFNASGVQQGPKNISGTAEMSEIPVFVRPGAVVPLAPVVQYSGALPGGALEVQVYGGADGTFELVEDDGETTAYEQGKVRTTTFKWSDASSTLSWSVDSGASSLPNAFTEVYVTKFADATVKSATKALGSSGSIVVSDLVVV